MKKITAIALGAVMSVAAAGLLAGCGLQAKGPQYEYTVIKSDKTYGFGKENPVVDGNVKIDGKFDESFYNESRKWFKGHKISNNEDGTLDVTTYFSKSGIVVAAKFRDSLPVVYSEHVATGNSSCFNCYFSVDSKSSPNYSVYEIECSAGNEFNFSIMTPLGIRNIDTSGYGIYSAVVRHGSVAKGECYGFDAEYFMPWSLFGLETRPELVYLNPTMISSRFNDENLLQDGAFRTWYNFGARQSPEISAWGAYNQGYVFDKDGFISNKITIQAAGGTVTEEWGYDWCLTGDTVNFNVKPEAGKELVSITANGRDVTGEVKKGVLSVRCGGDIEISATFAEKQEQ